MTELATIVDYCNQLLRIDQFEDYCPNGLQVEGVGQVSSIVSGVTASQQLIDAAIAAGADVLLVHHGYFWRGEQQVLVGIKRQRIASLIENKLSLLAYHLPLDRHPELGNNAQLARLMGWSIDASLLSAPALPLVCTATLDGEQTGENLAAELAAQLGRPPLHIPVDRPVRRVAWCTGAAQSYLAEAAALGVDAFISGEISEQTVHEAREYGVHYIAAGHHATERYGVQALGEQLAAKFGIEHQFIDCDNPV